MSEKKELKLEDLEKICGGNEKGVIGLTEEEMAEFNEILKECYETALAKDRNKFLQLINKAQHFKDAHPDAHFYLSNVINILQEVWLKSEIWIS